MISIIVAYTLNRVIGKNNSMPWNLPKDLKHFKEKTENNIVIMGRKTHESIGKILPNRINIVVSTTKKYNDINLYSALSLEEAIEIAHDLDKNKKIFIIGGSTLFKDAIKIVDEMIITHIQEEIDGDTYFPIFDITKFEIISSKIIKDELPCICKTYIRKYS